jgi:hypothetical protein
VTRGPRTQPIAVAALGLVLFAGCVGRGLVPREYVLTSLPAGEAAHASGPLDVSIGVGPVRLPAYLRRSELVSRTRENELSASDAEVWGEDLESGFARVLAENLGLLVPTDGVATFPWSEPANPDYRVVVWVQRFERDADGVVRLEARWQLSRRDRPDAAVVRRSTIEEPAGSAQAATVEAMSRALATLSREIADAIRATARGAAGARPG